MDISAMPMVFSSHFEWYSSKLNSIVAEKTANTTQGQGSRIMYTYQNAFHGLAAQLTDEEASVLGQAHGVMSLFPETMYHLHTTRSPVFLGLDQEDGILEQARTRTRTRAQNYDVIVGVLDTGIWPESQSFNDSGYGPVPARWKGACEKGRGFDPARHCNRKIIGARVFYKGYEASTGRFHEDMEYKSCNTPLFSEIYFIKFY